MSPAALRFSGLLAAALLAFVAGRAAEASSPPRSAPTRPAGAVISAVSGAPLAGRKFGKVEYVSVTDAAARLGLPVTVTNNGRKATLGSGRARAAFESGEREADINGLRVFLGEPAEDAGGQLYLSRIDYERCLLPLLRPGSGVAARPRPRVIALDPGHGGRDTGKTNARLGIVEKTVALDTSLRLKKLLEAAGYRVVLTRDDDTFIDLAQRAAVANLAKADVFVSVHFNALENDTRTSGVEVFTFAPQFQNSSAAWGAGERPDRESEASPVNAFDHWNMVLAQPLHRALLTSLEASDRGKKLMHLKMLRPLRCPGVLVECGFLTSDAEVKKIATPAYRQKIAEALLAGIQSYAATLDALQTRGGTQG